MNLKKENNISEKNHMKFINCIGNLSEKRNCTEISLAIQLRNSSNQSREILMHSLKNL